MASLRDFFERFEQLSADSDPGALAALYAPTFMVAGAAGSQPVKASDLALAIPRRREMLAQAGCSPARLKSLDETALDDRYTLARATWEWECAHDGRPTQALTVASTYLVERTHDRLQIVLYLAHGDIMALLRERGLLA